MRHLAICFLVISSTIQTYSQANLDTNVKKNFIVGVWQIRTSTVSSALEENFRFFKDGKFAYYISSYEELNPLRQIDGIFRIENGILKLRITKIMMFVDFRIDESSHGFQSGPFALANGKLVAKLQNDSAFSEHEFEILAGDGKSPITKVKIDGDTYFKLSGDPNMLK